MAWLIIAGIITLILTLALLLLPVTISVDLLRYGGRISGSFSINWLMLLVRYAFKDRQIELFVFSRRIVGLQHKEKPLMPEAVKKPGIYKKSKLHIRHVLILAGPLLRLLRDVVAAFRLKYLDIDITYGLNNPAYTGILTGLLHAVRGSLHIGHSIRFTPDFTGQVLDWKLKASAAIAPIQILPPIARFVSNRQVLRSGWGIIRDSW